MNHAIKTGKIQAGEIKLHAFKEELKVLLGGMKVDLSVIKKGGPFDTPPFIPINRRAYHV